ncbi:MAG: hypothetical protein JWM32_2648 [Verrucomicrobia bacterium]|nr:hypothetical protein [Verrucomicrobiota bacterium]
MAMDPHLTLAAQSFILAPDLQHSELVGGLHIIKNASTKTYLRVTRGQWRILEFFAEARSVPTVLANALDARVCLPLGEFYELILKAVQKKVLIEPGVTVSVAPVYGWPVGIRASTVVRPLMLLLVAGVAGAFTFPPSLPGSILDVVIGVALVGLSLSLGSVIAACLVRGGGGEVLPLPWRWWRLTWIFAVDASDVIMLPAIAQRAAALARPAILATTAGITAWQKPDWGFLPLVALAVSLRPILGGNIPALIGFNRGGQLSDAEHEFVFPPNHRPKKRWEMLRRAIRHPDTWMRLLYGIIWTLAVIYVAGRLTEVPPWTMGFWEANGFRVLLAISGSLLLLSTAYLAWELYYVAREHARTRRSVIRLWHRRWFGAKKLTLVEGDRVKAVNESPLFRTLPPSDRQQLAHKMFVTRHNAWQALSEYGPVSTRISLIVAGRVALYRKGPSGQLRRVQVLSEGDIVGLHDVADPKNPEYFVRTLSPVTLFTIDRKEADEIAIAKMPRTTLANTVLKLSFLKRIPLCQNWHYQAVERFASLSAITDLEDGTVIFPENQFNQDFFVIFEGDASVTRGGRRLAVIHGGDFFGEIGLLQNSPSTAQVAAKGRNRVLSIDRIEFLRFVTHNYTVALELERVSSNRLGYPIFPLRKGNFRVT